MISSAATSSGRSALCETKATAVILASGVNRIALYPGYEPGYKALIPFHGRASIHYVLDALDAAPGIGEIGVIGPPDALSPELARRGIEHLVVEGGDTILRSVEIALDAFGGHGPVLITTGDLPLLTPDSVTEFLAGCAAAPVRFEHNVYMAGVPQSAYAGPYVQFPKNFNRYRDVTLCHGNLALVDPEIRDVPGVRERFAALYAARKSPIGSALALGLKIGLTYAIGVEMFHFVTLGYMARVGSASLGFGVVPVLIDRPEITIDVDEPEDYVFVRQQLEAAGPSVRCAS